MKKYFFLIIVILIFLQYKCKKSTSNSEPDNIHSWNINKSLVNKSVDTIDLTVYEIYKMNDSFVAKLSFPRIICDCSLSYLTDSKNGNILALKENETISENNNWDVNLSNNFNLYNFKGKRELYIGYRNLYFPDGISHYCYGWIKICLSANCDTLRIIEAAINFTENGKIITGQKK